MSAAPMLRAVLAELAELGMRIEVQMPGRCESRCGSLGQCAMYNGHLDDEVPGQRRHMNTRGDTWCQGDESVNAKCEWPEVGERCSVGLCKACPRWRK